MRSNIFSTENWPAGTRVALRVEYDGSAFHGLASPTAVTLRYGTRMSRGRTHTDCQQHDKKPLCRPHRQRCSWFCAKLSISTIPVARNAKAWVVGTNSLLPNTVRVHWAQGVSKGFSCAIFGDRSALSVHHSEHRYSLGTSQWQGQ